MRFWAGWAVDRNRRRVTFNPVVLILAKGAPGSIRRDGGVAALGVCEPCRVTTGYSRLMSAHEVARVVAATARRSR